MTGLQRWCVLVAVLLPTAALSADTVYKSVDESGNVTYSAEPPADAATVEALELPAGPSQEATREALDRAQEIEREADTGYDAMMERRRQEEARARAQRQALPEEQSGRAENSSEVSDSSATGYIWYRPQWIRPHPPRPPHPPWPPQPPPRRPGP